MCDLSLILLAAGESSRFKAPVKKQWLRLNDEPLWQYVARDLQSKFNFKKIIIVANEAEISYMRYVDDSFLYAKGGNLRQTSVKNALEFVTSEFVLVSDVARAEISQKLIDNLVLNLENFDCVSPYLGVNDTTYLGSKIINRDEIKLIQTPQISRTSLLKQALLSDEIFTDDSSAIASVGGKLAFVDGDTKAHKITRIKDLERFSFPDTSKDVLVGNGFDVHKFANGEFIILCGEKIPCKFSLLAHSDGDVAIHALIDAMLGACGLGDIGELYPDTDIKYKGADSTILLKDVVKKINSFGFEVVNADITIIAQSPKLTPYKEKMRLNLSKILNTKKVNVKATTTENLGFTGRSEGIAVIATTSLRYIDWKIL